MTRRAPLATTFTEAEVELVLRAMGAAQRGYFFAADMETLRRSSEWASVWRKFDRMRKKAKGSD